MVNDFTTANDLFDCEINQYPLRIPWIGLLQVLMKWRYNTHPSRYKFPP